MCSVTQNAVGCGDCPGKRTAPSAATSGCWSSGPPRLVLQLMSPLAKLVYDRLRVRDPALRPELSYTELVEQLPSPYAGLSPDSDVLAHALGELVQACRDRDLPPISAMVLRHRERVPGPGYYPAAHPNEADDPAKAMIAWGIELTKVRVATYPPAL